MKLEKTAKNVNKNNKKIANSICPFNKTKAMEKLIINPIILRYLLFIIFKTI